MRNQFFVVTKTSVYHITYDETKNRIEIEKVHQKSESQILEGFKMSPKWNSITIAKNIFWDDWHTSYIIGLFDTLDEAMQCIKNDDLVFNDPRWKTQTNTILNEIGSNHPAFNIIYAPGNLAE